MAAFLFLRVKSMKGAIWIVFLWATVSLAQVSGFRSLSQPEISKLLSKARNGNTESQLRLGMAYEYGLGVEADAKTAEYWLKTAAGFGDSEAQTQLGLLYLQPQFANSHAQAVPWFMRASAGGSARAAHNLGLMYTLGLGVPMDREQAIRWYRRAAQHGLSQSRANLGVLLVESENPADQAEGFHILERAAKSGDADAENSLAYCYRYGVGTKPDIVKAVNLYSRSSAHGNLVARKNLGDLYKTGSGVPQNSSEAFRHYEDACNAGEWRACVPVANAYLFGEGIARNEFKAYQFALMGGVVGEPLQVLGKHLSESDKNVAAEEAERWKQTHAVLLSALPH
jgi:hypothetical protein